LKFEEGPEEPRWKGPVQGRRHEFKGGGSVHWKVGVITIKTQTFEKGGGCMTSPAPMVAPERPCPCGLHRQHRPNNRLVTELSASQSNGMPYAFLQTQNTSQTFTDFSG